MPNDNSIALQVQTPDAMKSIGGMLNIANTAQQIKQGNVALQKEQIILGERKGIQQLFSDPSKFNDADGNPDYNKLINEGMKVAPTTFPSMVPQIIQAHKSSIDAKAALNTLNEQQRTAVGRYVMSLGDDTPEVAKKKLDALVNMNPQLKPAVDHAWQYALAPNAGNPTSWKVAALKIGQSTMTPSEQKEAMTPSGPVISSGQTTQQFNTNPMAGPTGPVAGTRVQQQIPPTAQTVGPNGQPAYVGPQGGGGRQVPAGNPPGLEASATGSAATANKDWESTVESAKTASTDIANLTNIKRFAGSAQTGVGSDRRAFVAGLAGLVGLDYGEMTKTKTDLLAKNANMLALAGGDTNLAKTLAESANPNTHMTKEAILEAANQVMSQRRMALAKQEFLQPHKALNSPDSYGKALTEWNKVADPRIFQWPHMSPEEKRDMKAAMTPKEQQEFRGKVQRAVELGIVK